jgi:hypothetical protein
MSRYLRTYACGTLASAGTGGAGKLRAVHVLPDISNTDFGTGSGSEFQSLFTDAAYGAAGILP